MAQQKHDGGPAFPNISPDEIVNGRFQTAMTGMSLRDWFAGHALANAELCTGDATQWQLRAWFGERGGVTRAEIAAAQAADIADAMLAERAKARGE